MNQMPKATPLLDPFPPQQAYLAIEQQPASAAEKRALLAVRRHVQAHTHTTDLRELVGAVKKLLGTGYAVGCGTAHVWVLRVGEQQRLAIVADRLTTAYRDWFEPPLEEVTGTSRTPRRRLPVSGTQLAPDPG